MLNHAQLQHRYRAISLGFLLLVLLTVGGVVFAGWSQATIDVTPVTSEVQAAFTITVSPDGQGPNGIEGTITLGEQSASVTTEPGTEGVQQPAQARGLVTIVNTTSGAQALAQGTRLQSSTGVIVRTVNRVDVPAHGQIQVEAVADPSGTEGEIPPGRLIIVALRAANQELIYGQNDQAFTGGTVRVTGSLSIEELTQASNQALEKITQAFGPSHAGKFHSLIPKEVATEPKPEVPSTSYTVTVTATTLEVTYDTDALATLATERLNEHVAVDQRLVSEAAPEITIDEQPTLDSITLTIKVRGQAELSPDSKLLDPSQFVGLESTAITSKLLGSKLVKSVDVGFSPWWRRRAPAQPARIDIRLITTQK